MQHLDYHWKRLTRSPMPCCRNTKTDIKDPNIGQIVHDVYDLEVFQPKPGWQKVYDEVKQEAIGLGIPL